MDKRKGKPNKIPNAGHTFWFVIHDLCLFWSRLVCILVSGLRLNLDWTCKIHQVSLWDVSSVVSEVDEDDEVTGSHSVLSLSVFSLTSCGLVRLVVILGCSATTITCPILTDVERIPISSTELDVNRRVLISDQHWLSTDTLSRGIRITIGMEKVGSVHP